MLKFFIVIIIFLLALSLFLGMSVGVAFSLVWIFPAISFEIGVLIGAVSLSMIFYGFLNIINVFPRIYLPTLEDDYMVDRDYDEYDLDKIIPPRSTRSRSNRRKRR